MSEISERLRCFINYKELSVSKFERSIGVSTGFVNNISKGIGSDKLQRISLEYPDLSRDWLLYGEGEMLNQPQKSNTILGASTDSLPTNSLPVIPIDAVAGFNGCDLRGVTLADCPQYHVPDFVAAGAEYLIRVSGASMYPKYSNGDLLACRRITDILFFQWGKVYVIDSSQGAMVKRLFPCEDSEDHIMCHSDNDKYPPFRLPKSDIRSLSIVVGVLRLE